MANALAPRLNYVLEEQVIPEQPDFDNLPQPLDGLSEMSKPQMERFRASMRVLWRNRPKALLKSELYDYSLKLWREMEHWQVFNYGQGDMRYWSLGGRGGELLAWWAAFQTALFMARSGVLEAVESEKKLAWPMQLLYWHGFLHGLQAQSRGWGQNEAGAELQTSPWMEEIKEIIDSLSDTPT